MCLVVLEWMYCNALDRHPKNADKQSFLSKNSANKHVSQSTNLIALSDPVLSHISSIKVSKLY